MLKIIYGVSLINFCIFRIDPTFIDPFDPDIHETVYTTELQKHSGPSPD